MCYFDVMQWTKLATHQLFECTICIRIKYLIVSCLIMIHYDAEYTIHSICSKAYEYSA